MNIKRLRVQKKISDILGHSNFLVIHFVSVEVGFITSKKGLDVYYIKLCIELSHEFLNHLRLKILGDLRKAKS